MKFNIAGKNKAAILISLFYNAVKSEWTKWTCINKKFPVVRKDPSFYFRHATEIKDEIAKLALSEEEATALLASNPNVGYIGFVKIAIDFQGDVIDTTHYDKDNANGASSAADVLIEKYGINPMESPSEPGQSFFNAPWATFHHQSVTANHNKLEPETGEKIKQLIAELIGNQHFAFLIILDNWHTLKFEPAQSFEMLERYAATLKSAGLNVRVHKEGPLSDALIKLPAEIEIKSTTDTIIKNLSAFLAIKNILTSVLQSLPVNPKENESEKPGIKLSM